MISQTIKQVVRPSLELTLAILKPDVCKDPKRLDAVRNMVKINGFYFIRSLMTRLSESDAKDFYAEHRDKFFYWRLVSFMSSGIISVHILAKHNAIADWRQLMGPTKVYMAKFNEPNTIRAMYGLSDTRNATHGSDSFQSFRKESKQFFPDFDCDHWLANDMPAFSDGTRIEFIANQWLHRIKT